ncbi:MAG: hypothetical protein ABI743_07565, partial [bacterium]
MTPRAYLAALLIPGLALAAGCSIFDASNDLLVPHPGPRPPDNNPPPVDPPVRTPVVTPSNPAPAGITVTFATTGEAFRVNDLIAWSIAPSATTTAKFPTGGGGVLFPELSRLSATLTIDSVTPVAANWRLATPGTYTLTETETGDGYAPVVHTFDLSITGGPADTFRPEATEVTGYPPFHVDNV